MSHSKRFVLAVLAILAVLALLGCTEGRQCDCGCAKWDVVGDDTTGGVKSVCTQCVPCPKPQLTGGSFSPIPGDTMSLGDAVSCAASYHADQPCK